VSAAQQAEAKPPFVPVQLAQLDRWLLWKEVVRNDKPTKVPKTCGGSFAKSTDPTTWRSLNAATSALAQKPGLFDGIGFALGELDASLNVGGIDLDSCIGKDGQIEPWAAPIAAALANLTYMEVSPSGSGLKAFFFLTAEDFAAVRKPFAIDPDKFGFKRTVGDADGREHPPAIEAYLGRGRYFAVTGKRYAGAAEEVATLDQATLLRLAGLIDQAVETKPTPGKPKRSGPKDTSRSAKAFKVGAQARRDGATFEQMCKAIREHPETAEWYREKGEVNGKRELHNIWDKAQPIEWIEHCQKNQDGNLRSNLANVMTALREAAELQTLLAFDEMLQKAVVLRSPPRGINGGEYPRPLRDDDVTATQEWLQRAGLTSVGEGIVRQAIERHARDKCFHPVRDYLNSLKWDGVKRVHGWLHTCLGAEDTPYTQEIGKLFLISMVARVFKPGCKADHMLILEGEQGALKSSACRILAGQWFSDNLPPIHADPVRTQQHLRGRWLIEVAEMHAMNRAETSDLKQFLSRQNEDYIPKYGHFEVNESRQCVFIGSTNKQVYLRDETGGRRFWPVAVGVIRLDILQKLRNQLFAEAVHLHREDVQWWPDKAFEEKHIKPQQEARYEGDAWEQSIAEYLDGKAKVTLMEVAEQVLSIEVGRFGTRDQNRLKAVLESLGWYRGERTGSGRPWLSPLPSNF
jgi:predicted P-loop ATPase